MKKTHKHINVTAKPCDGTNQFQMTDKVINYSHWHDTYTWLVVSLIS